MHPSDIIHANLWPLVRSFLGAVLYLAAGVLLLRVKEGKRVCRPVGVLCLVFAVVGMAGAFTFPFVGVLFAQSPVIRSLNPVSLAVLSLWLVAAEAVLYLAAGVLLLRVKEGKRVCRPMGVLCLVFTVGTVVVSILPVVQFLF